MIDERDTRTLLRRLRGELSSQEQRRLEERLAAVPELRAAAQGLERGWNDLELPPAAAPPGFSAGVMERIAAAESETPAWARLAAAAALAAGIALGVGIGRLPADEALPEALAGPPPPTLAERYFTALAELDPEVHE